ncbi:MAG: tRNA (adenosine(37)-N6)-threonylcarbamoyltransferase complex dimerization subunit type 1 TsaB [Spirochaetia bacterium]|nr:tRNA (adenosine(37)-N6)-threonylcarbamoyltransferase complex dimerization subunit type 1 TsaB [Spirochaetia bacterium]
MKTQEDYREKNERNNDADKICLVFDATNQWIIAGIFGPMESEISIRADRDSFTKLTPVIADQLKKNQIQKPDWIITTLGPGSYTGTKISVTAARTLSALWNIPVMGVDSLTFYFNFVCKNLPPGTPAGVLLDARQKKVYAKVSQNALKESSNLDSRNLLDIPPDDLFTHLKPCRLFADDPQTIMNYTESSHSHVPEPLLNPDAKTLYETGIASGGFDHTADYESLIPLYLREDPATAKYPEGLTRK